MPAYWYTMRVKPHKERMVDSYLQSHDVDTYLPLVKVNPVNPRESKVRPYFPGYLFVHVDLDEIGQNTLNWTPGAHGLVQFDGEPATVPDRLVDELEKTLFEIEKSGGLNLKHIESGDPVRIVSGPFAGYTGIFNAYASGKERVEVLLAFLSDHPQRMQLNSADIEKL